MPRSAPTGRLVTCSRSALRYANSGNRNQTTPGGGSNSNTIDIRHSAWWIDNKTLGRVWVGKTSTATDGITEINLANVNTVGSGDAWIGGFFLRNANGSLSAHEVEQHHAELRSARGTSTAIATRS